MRYNSNDLVTLGVLYKSIQRIVGLIYIFFSGSKPLIFNAFIDCIRNDFDTRRPIFGSSKIKLTGSSSETVSNIFILFFPSMFYFPQFFLLCAKLTFNNYKMLFLAEARELACKLLFNDPLSIRCKPNVLFVRTIKHVFPDAQDVCIFAKENFPRIFTT